MPAASYDPYYVDLTAIPTQQLTTLSPASGVPPQEISAEILRRSQMQNAHGYSGLPSLADASSRQLPLVPRTPGATDAQENFGYPSLPAMGPILSDAASNIPSAISSAIGGPVLGPVVGKGVQQALSTANDHMPDFLRKTADYLKGGTPNNVVPPSALPSDTNSGLPPSDTSGADLMALLRQIPSGPHIDVTPTKIDYDKWADQVKKEMPDNLSGVAEALQAQKNDAAKGSKNALSQGLMSAGLSLLGSRGNFFTALGQAGKEGLGQYNQQKSQADAAQQALLGEQLRMEQVRQANNEAVAQQATARGAEDVRSQQINDDLKIKAALAQQNPALMRAQIGLMGLSMRKNPLQDMADSDFGQVMKGVEETMKDPMAMAGKDRMQFYQQALNYATQRRAAITRGQDPNRIPTPWTQAPAGVRAQ